MKRIVFLFLAICMSVLTVSADKTSAQARKLLDKVAANASLKSGATANFTISGGKLGNQAGTIAIKGNKFNARTANAIMWYDGKTQWVYNKKNEEVNVSSPSAAQQQAMNPYTFISIYKNGYDLSLVKSASGQQVHMVGKGKSISEMYLLVAKDNTIKQVKLKQNNQWITINITNFKKQSLADSAFRFNAKDYPKAEVIDLR